jgi:putative tricarboxylic transport membrane protein
VRAANLAIAVGAILVSAAILYGSRSYPFWARTAPGTGFMPVLLGLVGLGLGLALLIGALRERKSEALDLPDRATRPRIAGAMLGLTLAVFLTPIVGLLLGQVIFMLFMLLGLQRRPIVPSVATTAITAGLIYGVFMQWLRVPLPRGPLGF